jgi:HK97 family phage portal protein
MTNHRTALVMTGNGLKSIPLSAFGPEAWTSLFGSASEGTAAAYYERVPWLYAPVNLIANAVGSLPVRWEDPATDEPIDEPSTTWGQSFGDLLNAVTGDLLLYGAGYVFRANNRRGVPTELRRLLPTTITPKFDAVAGLTHFERRLNGQMMRLELADVIYFWEPNRVGETGPGTSRARAALAASGALAAIDASTENLFANGAIRPTIAFIDEQMPDAELQRVESTIRRRLQGVKNAFGFTAVSKKVEFSTIGDKPSDLTMPELTASKRQDVATALGVPESMLSSSAANYATSHQDTLNFYDMTVIPIAKKLLSAFNSQCFEALGFCVETAEDELEIYQAMQGEQVAALAQLVDRRIITINEARERVGFAPFEDPAMLEPEEPQSDPQAAGEEPDALPEPEDNPADTQQKDELRAWQRFVTRRLKEGRPVRAFKAQYLPAVTVAAIEGQIEAETDPAAVRAVFEAAERWLGYP